MAFKRDVLNEINICLGNYDYKQLEESLVKQVLKYNAIFKNWKKDLLEEKLCAYVNLKNELNDTLLARKDRERKRLDKYSDKFSTIKRSTQTENSVKSSIDKDELVDKAILLLNSRNKVIEQCRKSHCFTELESASFNHATPTKSTSMNFDRKEKRTEMDKIVDKLCDFCTRQNLVSNYSSSNYVSKKKEQPSLHVHKKSLNLEVIDYGKSKKQKCSPNDINEANYVPPVCQINERESISEFNNIDFNKNSPYDIGIWKKFINNLQNNQLLMNYALSKNLNDFKCLDDLVSFFDFSPASYDVEKIWMIYVWLAENIEYDIDSLKMRTVGKIHPVEVFSSGKCICQGFSLLFKYLCNRLGFECIVIIGHSKGSDFDTLNNFQNGDYHAWNAVKIDGRWEYVDCTWSSGYLEMSIDQEVKFIKHFNIHYFLTPPQIFIFDHYSKNYQLQMPRITLAEFIKLPLITLNFHIYEFEFVSNVASEIETCETRFKIELKCPKTVTLSANLKEIDGENIDNAIYLGRNPLSNNYEIQVSFPKSNQQYVLKLYARHTSEKMKAFDKICNLIIKSNNHNLNTANCMVHRFKTPSIESFLFHPLELHLSKFSVEHFKLHVKNAEKVVLRDSESNWTFFEKKDLDMWHLDYLCATVGRIYIFAKSDSHPFCPIYSFDVI